MKQKQKSELSDESDKEFEEEGSDEDEQEMRNTQFDPNNSEDGNESYQDWIQQHFE